MSPQTRNEREGTSRLDLRTLVIASVASAVAAIVVSRVWISGTPIAAAMTPVVVTLLKEALDRPTARIAEKVTVQSRARPDTVIREPAAGRVGRQVQREDGPTRSLDSDGHPPGDGDGRDPGAIRVYRQQPANGVLQRINPKVVLITGLLAFVIAGVVITAGQIAIGNPFGSHGKGALILGQHKRHTDNKDAKQTDTTTTPSQSTPQNTTTPSQSPGQPQNTTTTPQTTTPQSTTPQATPKSQPETTTTPAP